MKQKCKKILSVLLSIVMLLSITAGLDFSAYAKTSGDFVYEIQKNNTVEIVGYRGSASDLTIPSKINGLNVTKIGDGVFYHYINFKTITIPDSIKSIGDYAFSDCYNLTSITIPNGVKTIGEDAFYLVNNVNYNGSATGSPWGAKCVNGYVDGNLVYKDSTKKKLLGCSSLAKKATISNSVTSIGNYAFYYCGKLTNIIIPNSVTSIGKSAFGWCYGLKSVTIGSSVTSIGYYAFGECYELTDVYYRGSKEQWNKISIGGNNGDLKNATMHYHTTHNKNKVINKDIKKATLTSAGSYYSVVCCSLCDREMSRTKKIIPKIKSVKLSKTSYVYDGKVKKPSVTVKDAKGNTLKNGTDYTVSYAKGRKNVGKYSVKITFKGLYKGTKTLYFTIKPKATSISKLTAGSKKFTVKWYKRDKQVTGYQIQYSRNKSFENAKTKTVSKNSTTSKTISKLSAKKKYYVRVRTYKTVNGTKYYSGWSGYKYITTKV